MSNESFFDRVKDFITGHPEQADQGLDKAEEIIDERTGGQYSEQIAKGDDSSASSSGIPDDEATVPEPGDPPAVPGDPTPTPGTAPEPPRSRRPPSRHDAARTEPRPGTDVAARDGPRGRAGHHEHRSGAAGLNGPTAGDDKPVSRSRHRRSSRG